MRGLLRWIARDDGLYDMPPRPPGHRSPAQQEDPLAPGCMRAVGAVDPAYDPCGAGPISSEEGDR